MEHAIRLKDNREVAVRELTIADYEAVRDHMSAIAHETVFTNQYVGQPPKSREDFVLNLTKNLFFGVFDKENLIAMVSLYFHRPQHPWLNRTASFGIFVRQAYNHLGIGHHLMNLIEEKSRAHGIHRIEAEVRHLNTNAINLYLKHGYKIEGLKYDCALINGVWHHHYQIAKILNETPVH